MSDIHKKIGAFWSEASKRERPGDLRLRWWQSKDIIEHINQVVCGRKVPGVSQGLIKLDKEKYSSKLPFKKGISVGSGSGQKEINLVKQGIVDEFDLYELSGDRIEIGIDLVKREKLSDKIRFIKGDAFKLVPRDQEFDFVHWNNSLHHMFDVDESVSWSTSILRFGGLFYLDDFVGASRFQWSDRQLSLASKIRQIFGDSRFMRNPKDLTKLLSNTILRPNAARLAQDDPSEAADSDNILKAIVDYFPNAHIRKTGGLVYHLVLNDMLANFQENDDDKIMLNLLLMIDDLCSQLGESHYAIVLVIKE